MTEASWAQLSPCGLQAICDKQLPKHLSSQHCCLPVTSLADQQPLLCESHPCSEPGSHRVPGCAGLAARSLHCGLSGSPL